MQHRQQGMTFLGILVLVIVVGAWVYAGIRLVPKYLEYMRVAATLEKVRDEYDSNPGTTEFMLRKAVERHFDIEMVEIISSNDIQIKKEGGTFTMRAAYDDTVPLVSNISFLVEFDKTVEVAAR
jgi:DNA-dependent RNA polymerase auxiliary subunit epsilon